MSLAMDRHPVSFWVERFKVMPQKEADELIATFTDEPPLKLIQAQIERTGQLNFSWHGEKNREAAKTAHGHVYEGLPLPVADELDGTVDALTQEKARLEALLKTRDLKDEIADLKERVVATTIKAKAERENKEKEGDGDETEKTPTRKTPEPKQKAK